MLRPHAFVTAASILALGTLAAEPASAALLFHTSFDNGSGDPVATYLGAPIVGTLLDGDTGTDTPLYSSNVQPFATPGSFSMSFPGVQGSVARWADDDTPLDDNDLTKGTIAAWINLTGIGTDGGANGDRIFSTRAVEDPTGSGSGNTLEFHISATGQLELKSVATVSGDAGALAADDFGKWRFVAATWDTVADEVRFYVGDEFGNISSAGVVTGGGIGEAIVDEYVQIGGYKTGSYAGLIDDVYFYNHVLTANQLSQIAIPEPASLALLTLGAVLVVRRRTPSN